MGIVGIGVDIVRNDRFGAADGGGDRAGLLRACFTDAEWNDARASRNPAARMAISWAVKEALLKAIRTGFGTGIPMRDIEVRMQDNRIVIELGSAAAAAASRIGGDSVEATASTASGHTIAVVMLHGAGGAVAT